MQKFQKALATVRKINACYLSFLSVGLFLFIHGIVGPLVLWAAAQQGATSVVRLCVLLGQSLETRDNERTLLMYAVEQRDLSAVRSLLAAGANPDVAYEYNGMTVLMDAVAEDQYEVARELLLHGADVKVRRKDGKTAFSFVESAQDKEAMRKLLTDPPRRQ